MGVAMIMMLRGSRLPGLGRSLGGQRDNGLFDPRDLPNHKFRGAPDSLPQLTLRWVANYRDEGFSASDIDAAYRAAGCKRPAARTGDAPQRLQYIRFIRHGFCSLPTPLALAAYAPVKRLNAPLQARLKRLARKRLSIPRSGDQQRLCRYFAGRSIDAPQQPRSCWIGGQGTSPYEQKTQQSPDFGFSVAPQAGQSYRMQQESKAIVNVSA
jgi:hypothetical protein